MALFDTTSFRIAEQGLHLLVQQQAVIAQNIANQDTPDYHAKYLYFTAALKDELDRREEEKSQTHKKGVSQQFEAQTRRAAEEGAVKTHFTGASQKLEAQALREKEEESIKDISRRLSLVSTVYTDDTVKDQPDGNNVDSDTQEALFAKNAIQYEALINQMNSEFTMIRAAMRKS